MIPYLGDYAEDATVYIAFNTFSSNDPSASVTVTDLVAADIKVHKDGGTTEIVTDGATVAIDFDGVTGNHLITVDTSIHADYATGSDYLVRIEGVTVDGGVLNAFVAQFSIQNRYAAGALRPTTAGRTLDVTATGAAGLDWGNVENATTSNTLSGTTVGTATALGAQAKLDVNAEVVDVLETDTHTEASGPPAATSSLKDAIIWLRTLARNKITQTATTQTLRNDADSADVAASTVSDSAGTFTRGEWS